jgi:hypothetical protein
VDFDDWILLQQRFSMQSFAAVPLMVAGTVYGVILAASPTPGCFSPRCKIDGFFEVFAACVC